MRKSKSNAPGHWEKVWIIGGDSCLCRFEIEAAVDESGAGSTQKFGKGDSIRSVRTALTGFSMDERPSAVVVFNPLAEMHKMLLEVIQEGPFTAAALIVVTPGDTLDARAALVAAATKNKRLFYYSPIEAGERYALAEHLNGWEESLSVKIDRDAREWLLSNAPTLSSKVKTTGGKKELEVYDLDFFEAELGKMGRYRQTVGGSVTLDDVKTMCNFGQGTDIWALVKSATTGRGAEALRLLEDMSDAKGSSTALWLILSQLDFLIGLKSLLNAGIRNPDDIQQRMSPHVYMGKYFDDSWELPSDTKVCSPVNVWRIKKALEGDLSMTLGQLSTQYIATVSAVRDLRAGLSERIVMPYYCMALAGMAPYSEPLYDAGF